MDTLCEPRLICHRTASYPYYSSDSDLEPPHLSETPSETPPETPLRSSMLSDKNSSADSCGFSGVCFNGSATSSSGSTAKILNTEPLVLAVPRPVRPSLRAFRSFTPPNSRQLSDQGYDSERETPRRPPFQRFHSYRPSVELAKSPSQTTPKSGTGASVLWNPNAQNSSPIAKRPRHPPPIDIPPIKLEPEIQTDSPAFNLTRLADLLADPAMDVTSLQGGTSSSFRMNKDRSNQITGLGYGLPSTIHEDTSRIPTLVPLPAKALPMNMLFEVHGGGTQSVVQGASLIQEADAGGRGVVEDLVLEPGNLFDEAIPESAMSFEAPTLGPMEFGEGEDMSPLALPEPVLLARSRLIVEYSGLVTAST